MIVKQLSFMNLQKEFQKPPELFFSKMSNWVSIGDVSVWTFWAKKSGAIAPFCSITHQKPIL